MVERTIGPRFPEVTVERRGQADVFSVPSGQCEISAANPAGEQCHALVAGGRPGQGAYPIGLEIPRGKQMRCDMVAVIRRVRTVVDDSGYARPCIVGGIKRHFRDNGWSVHITRRMQELHLQTSRAIPRLTQTLGRTPTIADLAAHLRLSERDTRDGVNSSLAYRTQSLSTPASDNDDTELAQLVGGLDRRIESVPDRHLLGQHVAYLPAREQMILRLRFAGGLSQREIAEHLGISQMHVSRLLARTICLLRAGILAQR
jgi:RNA polymerase sigma-B factor